MNSGAQERVDLPGFTRSQINTKYFVAEYPDLPGGPFVARRQGRTKHYGPYGAVKGSLTLPSGLFLETRFSWDMFICEGCGQTEQLAIDACEKDFGLMAKEIQHVENHRIEREYTWFKDSCVIKPAKMYDYRHFMATGEKKCLHIQKNLDKAVDKIDD